MTVLEKKANGLLTNSWYVAAFNIRPRCSGASSPSCGDPATFVFTGDESPVDMETDGDMGPGRVLLGVGGDERLLSGGEARPRPKDDSPLIRARRLLLLR
jgi:hypothetical protein